MAKTYKPFQPKPKSRRERRREYERELKREIKHQKKLGRLKPDIEDDFSKFKYGLQKYFGPKKFSLMSDAQIQERDQFKRDFLAKNPEYVKYFSPQPRTESKKDVIKEVQPKESLADKVNKYFEHAASKYGGSKDYTATLSLMATELLGEDEPHEFKPGESNEYFTVDNSYNPSKPAELFAHIKFKNITETPDMEQWVEKLSKVHLSTPEGYQEWLDRVNHQIYESNIKDLDKIDAKMANTLEEIMNSSAAWHIAAKGAYDSDQVKEAWSTLYRKAKEVVESNKSVALDTLIQMVGNEEDLDDIISTLDNIIYTSFKEK